MKKFFSLLVLFLFSLNAFAGGYLIVNKSYNKIVYTPHYYEFDEDDNPKGYYWCGQTAFRMALEAQGVFKGALDIHNDFLATNTGSWLYTENNCSGGYCSSPVLFKEAVNNYKSNGENIGYSRVEVFSKSALLSVVKSEISKGNTIVSLSSRYYHYDSNTWKSVGHFFNINGFYDGSSGQYIYVRDPYKEFEGNTIYDKYFSLDEFYNKTKESNGRIVLSVISGS